MSKLQSAGFQPAQASSLLYRRLPVGRLCVLGRICGLEIRDKQAGSLRYASQSAKPAKYPGQGVCCPARTVWPWVNSRFCRFSLTRCAESDIFRRAT
jgi:hypothetical protein